MAGPKSDTIGKTKSEVFAWDDLTNNIGQYLGHAPADYKPKRIPLELGKWPQCLEDKQDYDTFKTLTTKGEFFSYSDTSASLFGGRSLALGGKLKDVLYRTKELTHPSRNERTGEDKSMPAGFCNDHGKPSVYKGHKYLDVTADMPSQYPVIVGTGLTSDSVFMLSDLLYHDTTKYYTSKDPRTGLYTLNTSPDRNHLGTFLERVTASDKFSPDQKQIIVDGLTKAYGLADEGRSLTWTTQVIGIALTAITTATTMWWQKREREKHMEALETERKKESGRKEPGLTDLIDQIITKETRDEIKRSGGGDLNPAAKNTIRKKVTETIRAYYERQIDKEVQHEALKAKFVLLAEKYVPKLRAWVTGERRAGIETPAILEARKKIANIDAEAIGAITEYCKRATNNLGSTVQAWLNTELTEKAAKFGTRSDLPGAQEMNEVEAKVKEVIGYNAQSTLALVDLTNLPEDAKKAMKSQLQGKLDHLDGEVQAAKEAVFEFIRTTPDRPLAKSTNMTKEAREMKQADLEQFNNEYGAVGKSSSQTRRKIINTISQPERAVAITTGYSGDGKTQDSKAVVGEMVSGEAGLDPRGFRYDTNHVVLNISGDLMDGKNPLRAEVDREPRPYLAYAEVQDQYVSELKQDLLKMRLLGQHVHLFISEMRDDIVKRPGFFQSLKVVLENGDLVSIMGCMTDDAWVELSDPRSQNYDGFQQIKGRATRISKPVVSRAEFVEIVSTVMQSNFFKRKYKLDFQPGGPNEPNIFEVIADSAKNDRGQFNFNEARKLILEIAGRKRDALHLRAEQSVSIGVEDVQTGYLLKTKADGARRFKDKIGQALNSDEGKRAIIDAETALRSAVPTSSPEGREKVAQLFASEWMEDARIRESYGTKGIAGYVADKLEDETVKSDLLSMLSSQDTPAPKTVSPSVPTAPEQTPSDVVKTIEAALEARYPRFQSWEPTVRKAKVAMVLSQWKSNSDLRENVEHAGGGVAEFIEILVTSDPRFERSLQQAEDIAKGPVESSLIVTATTEEIGKLSSSRMGRRPERGSATIGGMTFGLADVAIAAADHLGPALAKLGPIARQAGSRLKEGIGNSAVGAVPFAVGEYISNILSGHSNPSFEEFAKNYGTIAFGGGTGRTFVDGVINWSESRAFLSKPNLPTEGPLLSAKGISRRVFPLFTMMVLSDYVKNGKVDWEKVPSQLVPLLAVGVTTSGIGTLMLSSPLIRGVAKALKLVKVTSAAAAPETLGASLLGLCLASAVEFTLLKGLEAVALHSQEDQVREDYAWAIFRNNELIGQRRRGEDVPMKDVLEAMQTLSSASQMYETFHEARIEQLTQEWIGKRSELEREESDWLAAPLSGHKSHYEIRQTMKGRIEDLDADYKGRIQKIRDGGQTGIVPELPMVNPTGDYAHMRWQDRRALKEEGIFPMEGFKKQALRMSSSLQVKSVIASGLNGFLAQRDQYLQKYNTFWQAEMQKLVATADRPPVDQRSAPAQVSL